MPDVRVFVVVLMVWDVTVLLVKLDVVAVDVSVVRLVDVNVLVVPLVVWDVSVPDVPVLLPVKVRVVFVVRVEEDNDVCVVVVWLILLWLVDVSVLVVKLMVWDPDVPVEEVNVVEVCVPLVPLVPDADDVTDV